MLRHLGSLHHSPLRQAGWSDPAIVEATLTVAYFDLINCVSLGLGLFAGF